MPSSAGAMSTAPKRRPVATASVENTRAARRAMMELGGVPGEHDRGVVALVGVPGRAVHVDAELIAVLLATGEVAEPDGAVHRAERAGVLDRVAHVAARRRGA